MAVVAAGVLKRLVNLVCNTNVANCNDYTDELEENIQVNYECVMEFKASRSFQLHTVADVHHISY